MNENTYTCTMCKKKKTVDKGKKIPKCCGLPMVKMPLDICLQPDHAEHARPMNIDDACDDFRAGK